MSYYSFLAVKPNSDSGVSHIRLRDTTNPISYLYQSHSDNQVHVLEVHYKITKRMEFVKLDVVVRNSYYLYH